MAEISYKNLAKLMKSELQKAWSPSLWTWKGATVNHTIEFVNWTVSDVAGDLRDGLNDISFNFDYPRLQLYSSDGRGFILNTMRQAFLVGYFATRFFPFCIGYVMDCMFNNDHTLLREFDLEDETNGPMIMCMKWLSFIPACGVGLALAAVCAGALIVAPIVLAAVADVTTIALAAAVATISTTFSLISTGLIVGCGILASIGLAFVNAARLLGSILPAIDSLIMRAINGPQEEPLVQNIPAVPNRLAVQNVQGIEIQPEAQIAPQARDYAFIGRKLNENAPEGSQIRFDIERLNYDENNGDTNMPEGVAAQDESEFQPGLQPAIIIAPGGPR